MINYTNSLFWPRNTPFITISADDMVNRIENKLPCYEVTGLDDAVTRLYFDIDYHISDNSYDKDTDFFIKDVGIKIVKEFITNNFNIDPLIAVATSSYIKKYSWRYFVSNVKMKKNELKYFVHKMNEYVEQTSDIYDVIEKKDGLFDDSIYDNNRKMRCINTSKPNENRPLLLVDGTIRDTLITADLDFADLVSVEISVKTTVSSSTNCVTNKNKHIDLLLMLGASNYKRNDWVSICGWCHSHATKEIFLDFVSIQWKDDAENMWTSMTSKDIPIYWIETFAKRINKDVYKSWIEKWNIYFIPAEQIDDPYTVATIISNTLKQSLVLCNEKWFMLTSNNLWQQQKEPSFYIISELRKYIDESNKKIVYQISQTDGEQKEKLVEKSKIYLKSYKSISASGYLNVLTKFLKTPLADNSFENKLDNNPGFLAFKNGIVNLETKEFRETIQPHDYITKTIDFDYTVADPIKKQFVKNVLLKILNNNIEHLEYFLSLIGFTFIGSPELQKSIYFCVDKTDKSAGDNGKTFFFDILLHLLPNYTYKTDKSFFEDGNKKLHKQLAMMKGKRLVFADEFNEKKINSEFMKLIGDGLAIENEIMFGTSELINILFKAWILTNHCPNIDAKEQAVYNRYKQISYGSHFDRTGKRNVENVDKLEFIADTTLGNKIKNEYYNEVFEIIIEYANKYYVSKLPEIPKQFLNDAESTKMKNDVFGSWFNDNCQINEYERVALKLLVEKSGMTEKCVKEGMTRLGFKYNKDLSKMGKDANNKPYKGGFMGCTIRPDELDEDDTDSEKE
jgi:phage/plasmid-associated DNA primase